jgi:L-alanine-DL-glutamate epimerase-like enolase superfamily enzyme
MERPRPGGAFELKITGLTVDVLEVPLDRPVVSRTVTITSAYLVLVQLESDAGHTGVGFGTVLKQQYAAPLAALTDTLRDVVVGMDPTMCDQIAQALDRALFKAGPVGMSLWAVSAVDVAVWDLYGKIVGQPIYKLLGGTTNRLPAYPLRGLSHRTFEELEDELAVVVDEGWPAVKIFVSGLLSERGPRGVAERLRTLKEGVGSSIRLGLDNQDYWSPADAIRLGRMIEDLDLFWFEEPTDHRDPAGIAMVSAALDVPVCSGEQLFGIAPFRQLLAQNAADVVMIDVRMAGGMLPFMRIAAAAAMWHRPAVNHMMTAIDAHLLAAIPNAGLAEYVPWSDAIFEEPIQIVDGQIVLPETPGLGCTLKPGIIDALRA